ncbi:N-acetylmuramic acid 6-phosphate etherase [Alteromonas gilva]|uniref:N-acetylmuramic acid 6-phosphate etherase n=1 Tax=Alteromonas gilva TaxID=2987522 RepID=A0ABT5L580_9ALTE|nr:N-acetylmuramic acid 6-phosphate etherase [Alteromonas gilva]MDC8832199.1 N-acetylmuramic acid 6-phosphate etherase [Alteromonas gilva]
MQTTDKHSATLLEQLNRIISEGRNPGTMDIDVLPTIEILEKINQEDAGVADAVRKTIPHIAKAVDAIVPRLQKGGRLVYMGAGTSGRLGILDAVECKPTFSVSDKMVVGIIAGGDHAIKHAVEGAEDDTAKGIEDLKAIDFSANDVLIGLSASGRTPYVTAAMEYANSLAAVSVAVTCNPDSPMMACAGIGICAVVGAECLTGSTRMKSGTAQKLILNMISTASMIRLGKTYENLMVDVNASNQKLKARATRIVMQATDCTEDVADQALKDANNSAKLAILMILTGQNAEDAESLLAQHGGFLRRAVDSGLK